MGLKKLMVAVTVGILLVANCPEQGFTNDLKAATYSASRAGYPTRYTTSYLKVISKEYKKITKEENIKVALDLMKGTNADYSRSAILGNNLTGKPISVEFKNLASVGENYASFDALGWKKGSKLYIYINDCHYDAPPLALAALLAHEALHQDEHNSLAEETYAWTMEAAVWTELTQLYPKETNISHPLVTRENTLKRLFEKGHYTNKYIKKSVHSNSGYQNLPQTSPGFEDL